MKSARIIYAAALAAAALFYIVYPLWIAWYLLMLVVLLLPFDLLVSLPGMLSQRLVISAPEALEQGAVESVAVRAAPENKFTSGGILYRLRADTEENTSLFRMRCAGKNGMRELEIATGHSGLVKYEIERMKVLSLIGLFSLRRPAIGRSDVLILPKPLMPPNIHSLPQGQALRPKPGGGFAEEHDIRPYRTGDPKNSIHWKLSAKHDSLIIREALEVPQHSRLVKCAKWTGPEERDVTLSRLRWISDYLLEKGCPFYVSLESGHIAEIANEGDLMRFLRDALGGKATPAPSTPARFSWVFTVDARWSGI